jgi:PLP dependent protein
MTNEATTDTDSAWNRVRGDIDKAAKLAGRGTSSVQLIAVSKTRTADEIRLLLEASQRHFGENRVQETATKWPELRIEYPDVKLHLIGQLQSNKAAETVALFDVIHSVDRLSLIVALGKAMRESAKMVPCFIQVNIGEEPQKGGCAIADLPGLLAAAQNQGIPINGLMCIPPDALEPAPYFALLAELAARHGLRELSMGMSSDFPTAIMLGATYIRVGTALFGERLP